MVNSSNVYPVKGCLYRHMLYPMIYRCTSVTRTHHTLEYVWSLPGYDILAPMKTLSSSRKRRAKLVTTGGSTSEMKGWQPIDPIWFGTTWQELTDLIRDEFGNSDE